MEDRNILNIVADNPLLFDTLKKLLDDQFGLDDFRTDCADEILGQRIRACLVAREGIRNAFTKILQYKTTAPKPEIKNPAR